MFQSKTFWLHRLAGGIQLDLRDTAWVAASYLLGDTWYIQTLVYRRESSLDSRRKWEYLEFIFLSVFPVFVCLRLANIISPVELGEVLVERGVGVLMEWASHSDPQKMHLCFLRGVDPSVGSLCNIHIICLSSKLSVHLGEKPGETKSWWNI